MSFFTLSNIVRVSNQIINIIPAEKGLAKLAFTHLKVKTGKFFLCLQFLSVPKFYTSGDCTVLFCTRQMR